MFDNAARAVGVQGAANQLTKSATATPLLDRTAAALDESLKRLHNEIERVRNFADGVHGSRPSGGVAETGDKRVGRAAQIEERLGWLRESLNTLSDEIDRLSAI